MGFGAPKIQCGLKHLCRGILYFITASLVLFFIALYHGKCGRTAETTVHGEHNGVLATEKLINTCSANMFLSNEGCLPCPRGTFSFSGWSECQPWLNCSGISRQVRPRTRINGYVKAIWLAEWNGHQVVYANCSNATSRHKTRWCWLGMTKTIQLQGDFVTPLIGKCLDKLEIVTVYYKHGSAESLNKLLQQPQFSHYNNIQTRFQLSVDYVAIINFLHTSPIGILVMCDTNTLHKLMEQYLISDDFHLVLNDVDNLPEVKREQGMFVKCYNNEKVLPLAAPEQKLPAYDEKIDIWKIPAVVAKFLGKAKGSGFAKRQLREVMARCKTIDPSQRPTAKEVLRELQRVQQLITKNIP